MFPMKINRVDLPEWKVKTVNNGDRIWQGKPPMFPCLSPNRTDNRVITIAIIDKSVWFPIIKTHYRSGAEIFST